MYLSVLMGLVLILGVMTNYLCNGVVLVIQSYDKYLPQRDNTEIIVVW